MARACHERIHSAFGAAALAGFRATGLCVLLVIVCQRKLLNHSCYGYETENDDRTKDGSNKKNSTTTRTTRTMKRLMTIMMLMLMLMLMLMMTTTIMTVLMMTVIMMMNIW